MRSQGFLDYPSNCFRKHVFEDLKPYVCTIDKCEEPRILYNHSAMWAEHESSHAMPSTAECPFCGANFQQRALAYFKHVAAHLQEVSLSVLPHPADEDDGFDSEDSNNEDNSSISDQNLIENIQHDSSMKQADLWSENENYLDIIIERLLAIKGKPGAHVPLLELQIRYLCNKAKEVFKSQSMLLELIAPLKVFRLILPVLQILLAYVIRFLVISTANIMISWNTLSMEDFRPRLITCSWGIT